MILTGMKKLSIHWAPILKKFPLIWIAYILSVVLPVLWRKCQRVFSSCCTLAHARHAGRFDCQMSSLIPMMAEDIVAILKGHVPNPNHRDSEYLKMCAIKQIKICAKYRDMEPKASVCLSGTHGLRCIGLIPGSWQTHLDLGCNVPVFCTDLNL